MNHTSASYHPVRAVPVPFFCILQPFCTNQHKCKVYLKDGAEDTQFIWEQLQVNYSSLAPEEICEHFGHTMIFFLLLKRDENNVR